MSVGPYISSVGHIGLLGWLFFGAGFSSDPLPFEVTEVSVISTEAFEALTASAPPQSVVTETAVPAAPDTEPTPTAPTPDVPVETTPAPTPSEPEVQDAPPDVIEIAPLPDTEVSDTAPPVPSEPEIVQTQPDFEVSARPVARPVPRVAPEAVAPPEPDTAVAEAEQEQVTPDVQGETEVEPSDASAPEAAATEIVTEAEQPSFAPTTSVRPQVRPVRQAQATPAIEPRPTEVVEPTNIQPTDTSVAEALAEALAQSIVSPPVLAGPPLTSGEKDALRVAVSSCWNVGPLSSDDLQTTVVVAVDMQQDARPIAGSIRLVSSSGGSSSAANQAFEAARRAIIRCGRRGFDLPTEKYEQWREIEMTFNPEQMRIK